MRERETKSLDIDRHEHTHTHMIASIFPSFGGESDRSGLSFFLSFFETESRDVAWGSHAKSMEGSDISGMG